MRPSKPSPAKPSQDKASITPKSKLYRFRVDNWLSVADANLLLQKQAELAVKKKDYSRALSLFDRLIAYEPDRAEHFNNRGLVHYAAQHWARAESDYNHAIALNPDQDRAYNNRANLHAVQQNWAEAIADYDTAIDINPLNIRARLNQAITFREISDYEEALACLDIALLFVGASTSDRSRFLRASIYAERGRTHHLQGGWNCAIADYRKAIALSTNETVTRRVDRWMSALTQPCW